MIENGSGARAAGDSRSEDRGEELTGLDVEIITGAWNGTKGVVGENRVWAHETGAEQYGQEMKKE